MGVSNSILFAGEVRALIPFGCVSGTGNAVAIVSNIRTDTSTGQTLELNSDAHIIINSEANVQGESGLDVSRGREEMR
jgi:hypothetical protein